MYVQDIYFRHMGLWPLWQKQLFEAQTNEFMPQNTVASDQLNTP